MIKENQTKSNIALLVGIIVSLLLCASFWVGINLGYLSLNNTIQLIFVVYSLFYFIWISPIRPLFYNYIIPILFWLLLLVSAMCLNFYRVSNYYVILPCIITTSLSFLVVYFYKKATKGVFYLMLSISVIFICVTTFYLLPLHYYNESEVKTYPDKLFEFKAKEILLMDFSGNAVNLKNINAKIIFFEFGFAGCPPCIEKEPTLKKLRSNFKSDKNIIFIHIVNGAADSFDDFKTTYKEKANNFDLFLYAPKESMAEMITYFGIKGYPFEKVYVNNKAVFTHTGFSNDEANYYYNNRLKSFKKILKQ